MSAPSPKRHRRIIPSAQPPRVAFARKRNSDSKNRLPTPSNREFHLRRAKAQRFEPLSRPLRQHTCDDCANSEVRASQSRSQPHPRPRRCPIHQQPNLGALMSLWSSQSIDNRKPSFDVGDHPLSSGPPIENRNQPPRLRSPIDNLDQSPYRESAIQIPSVLGVLVLGFRFSPSFRNSSFVIRNSFCATPCHYLAKIFHRAAISHFKPPPHGLKRHPMNLSNLTMLGLAVGRLAKMSCLSGVATVRNCEFLEMFGICSPVRYDARLDGGTVVGDASFGSTARRT